MTISELFAAIKLKLDKSAGLTLPHFEDEELEFWLNEAIEKFAKTRYSGANPKQQGFEQSQKRIDDLRTLVREVRLALSAPTSNVNKPNSKTASISSLPNYWFSLGEEVLIAYVSLSNSRTSLSITGLNSGSMYYVVSGTITHNGVLYTAGDFFLAVNALYVVVATAKVILADTKRVGITETTSNNYYENLKDPYSEHKLHYEDAKPLRLFFDREIEFVHDGTYDIFYAYIRYLQQPQRIAIATDIATGSIQEGVTYEVYGGTSVFYEGTTYTVGQTFVGVSGVGASDYTEIGAPDVVVTINLPQHTHSEIVNIATEMLLENIEQPRIATFTNQVNTME